MGETMSPSEWEGLSVCMHLHVFVMCVLHFGQSSSCSKQKETEEGGPNSIRHTSLQKLSLEEAAGMKQPDCTRFHIVVFAIEKLNELLRSLLMAAVLCFFAIRLTVTQGVAQVAADTLQQAIY